MITELGLERLCRGCGEFWPVDATFWYFTRRGKVLGRQPGQRPKSDRLAPKVLALVAQGRSYRLIGRELGLSKNTVADIVKRAREGGAAEP